MKRHPALVPLSHHHQNALVLAKKLRAANDQTTLEERRSLAKSVLEFWEGHGRDHFREEEEILLPIWAKYEDPWSAPVEGMLRDHIAIRCMVQTVDAFLAEENAPETKLLNGLGERLDSHIRLEEHEVFEMAQAAIPEKDLRMIQELILSFEE